MKFKTMSLRTVGFAVLGVALASIASCSGGDNTEALQHAASVADSIVCANGDANVEVNAAGTGLDATFRIADTLINVQSIGKELFEVYASQQLKTVSPDAINLISHALRETKGDITVELLAEGQQPQTFTLTPRRFVDLQKARLTQLDPAIAKEQVVKVAEGMCPNSKAHAGALRVDVAVVKSFLEYNVVWPSEKDLAGKDQSTLTLNYFNSLKQELIDLGTLSQPVIDLLSSLSIDGVRMVYSAEGTDKVVKQAFPWRELQKPIEEYNVK